MSLLRQQNAFHLKSVETNIFILLGSNLGDREQYLSEAIEKIINEGCLITSTSSIYKTAPWGKTDQADFLNQVICISAKHTPLELLKILLQIEIDLRRIRKEKWGARTIDLDILFFNNQVINSEELTLPHPGIASRRFTLVPLAEIAPDFIHPVTDISCTMMLKMCSDPSVVEKFKP